MLGYFFLCENLVFKMSCKEYDNSFKIWVKKLVVGICRSLVICMDILYILIWGV